MKREWLIAIRQSKGISQKEMAERIGISAPSYNTIEHGKTNPRVATAQKIAGILGIPWTRFFEDPE